MSRFIVFVVAAVVSTVTLGQAPGAGGKENPGQKGLGPAPLPGQRRQGVIRPMGGPFAHQVLSATSRDGLTWTRDPGVRLEHASVPCAVVCKGRVFLYFVDANRGRGLQESVGCAISEDGLTFERQKLVIEGMTTRKALDPSILLDRDGKFRLYYLASSAQGDPARDQGPHEIHLATSEDGIQFKNVGKVFAREHLVDPDVFVFKETWFMYVFGRGDTLIATSADGREFANKGPLPLKGWGTVAPILLADGRLRLYAFDQRTQRANAVRSFLSTDGLEWKPEEGDRMVGGADEQITDPFVIRFKDGYKMYFKVEERKGAGMDAGREPGQERPQPGGGSGPDRQQPQNARAGDGPERPRRSGPGPWNNDVLVHRVTAGGEVTKLAIFERAGVPTIARLKDGRLIAAHQHFPEDSDADFDKVAVRFSADEGRTWSKPEVIRLKGLPEGLRFPFDPTLVPLPDGKIRLYFTSNRLRERGVPAIYSAISDKGVDYTVEPGMRFGIEGRPVIDCAVVLHNGVFHLYSPDNGAQRDERRAGNEPGQMRPVDGVGYHATSKDGLVFTRADDVKIEGRRRWLGNAVSDGKVITFIGTGDPGPAAGRERPREFDAPPDPNAPRDPNRNPQPNAPRGGIWMASSSDGSAFKLIEAPNVPGADPGAVRSKDDGWIIVSTGPPRPGTPGNGGHRPGADGPEDRDRPQDSNAGKALLERIQKNNPERARFASEQAAKIVMTADGRSFAVVWFPKHADGAAEKKALPVIVCLHGSRATAFDEFALWQPYAAKHGYGVIALQWWIGEGDETRDYSSPPQIYPALESLLRAHKVTPGRALLHGFSRASANLYAVMALDRQHGGRWFGLAIANAGGAAPDFPPNVAMGRGDFGRWPLAETRWVLYAGGRDPNPERDGIPAMRRAEEWITRCGGKVERFIEDAEAGHGGFHQTPAHVNAALDVFDKSLKNP